MRLKKTNPTNRTTYTYCFNEADEKGSYHIRIQTLRPGEDGVTELDIQMLHKLDDREVECNIRNLRPKKTEAEKTEQAEWLEGFKTDFLIKYGYEPTKDVIDVAIADRYPKNWNMSLSLFESDDDGMDTSDRHPELADPDAFADPDDRLPPDVRKMREIVATCTEKQQEAYRLVYIEGYTEEEAAGIAGCTQQGIHDRIKRVVEKIKNNF